MGKGKKKAQERGNDEPDTTHGSEKAKLKYQQKQLCFLCGEPGHLHSQCPESKGKRHRVTVLNGKGVCVAGNVEEGDDQWEKEEGASRVGHEELRRKKDKKKRAEVGEQPSCEESEAESEEDEEGRCADETRSFVLDDELCEPPATPTSSVFNARTVLTAARKAWRNDKKLQVVALVDCDTGECDTIDLASWPVWQRHQIAHRRED